MSQLLVAASTLDSWFNKSSNRWLLADENGLPVVPFTSFCQRISAMKAK